MIVARGLTKTYGAKTAVDGIDFTVEPGRVTGFLGPNGAGKSTTMRMILGLDRPTAGSVTVNGRRYADAPAPLREVGALLEAKAAAPRPLRAQPPALAGREQRHPARARVDEVLDLVGLDEVAGQRVGKFSLGMGQRLGIAVALLGDPPVVVLDEPVNGLDPEGIRWVRNLARQLAAEGRTVFVSSHLMREMALTADHLVVIGRGRILADCSMSRVHRRARRLVRPGAQPAARRGGRPAAPARVSTSRSTRTTSCACRASTPPRSASSSARAACFLHELTLVRSSLEDAFMTLTADSVEYHAATHRRDRPMTMTDDLPHRRPRPERRTSPASGSRASPTPCAPSGSSSGPCGRRSGRSSPCSSSAPASPCWSAAAAAEDLASGQAGESPASFVTWGMMFAQVTAVVLGAMVVTSEYGSGMIRATLAATPRRGEVLAAKAVVLTGTLLVAGTVTAFAGYFGGNWFLDREGIGIALSDEGVLRAMFGGGLYMAGLGLLAAAVGLLVRHTAAALSIVLGVVFVAGTMVFLLPGAWGEWIGKLMPGNAGSVITAPVSFNPVAARPVARLRGVHGRGGRRAARRLVHLPPAGCLTADCLRRLLTRSPARAELPRAGRLPSPGTVEG